MIQSNLPKRGVDDFGSGAFGASRGSRKHKGIDYSCFVDAEILSPVEGTVTKLGYCYSDDLSFRYVEITDYSNLRHRFFYVEPMVNVGAYLSKGIPIGLAQDVSKKWSTDTRQMKNHIHYEILDEDNDAINPEEVIE